MISQMRDLNVRRQESVSDQSLPCEAGSLGPCTCLVSARTPWFVRLPQEIVSAAQIVALCLLSLFLSGCTPPTQYHWYTPSPSSNAQVRFEYPASWQLYETNQGSSTELDLCEPMLSPTPPVFTGVHHCFQHIWLFTYVAHPGMPDVQAAISRTLSYPATTPDYMLVRRQVTVSGLRGERIEVCYTPAGYVIPNPPPVVMHAVYWQVGERIYEVSALTNADRPCSPVTQQFPVLEHVLETIVPLEP